MIPCGCWSWQIYIFMIWGFTRINCSSGRLQIWDNNLRSTIKLWEKDCNKKITRKQSQLQTSSNRNRHFPQYFGIAATCSEFSAWLVWNIKEIVLLYCQYWQGLTPGFRVKTILILGEAKINLNQFIFNSSDSPDCSSLFSKIFAVFVCLSSISLV